MTVASVCVMAGCLGVHALGVGCDVDPGSVAFKLDRPGRTSVGVYSADGKTLLRTLMTAERLEAGVHQLRWDGLDWDGRPVEPGEYQWKLISSPSIESRIMDSVGATPPDGCWTRWIGNHIGPSSITVGRQGVCVGAPIAEGPPSIHMYAPGFEKTRWMDPTLGWSAFGCRVVRLADDTVLSLSQDAKVKVWDAVKPGGLCWDMPTGKALREVDVLWEGDKRPGSLHGREYDLAACDGQNLFAVSQAERGVVRWYEIGTAKRVREVKIDNPRRIAMRRDGSLLVVGLAGLRLLDAEGRETSVVKPEALVNPVALAWDESGETILVANGAPDWRVLRFSQDGRLLNRYGVEGGRQMGPYYPDRFSEVCDLAADNGAFYVVEGGDAGGGLRRIARVGGDGTIVEERFGGAPFYSSAATTPGNPRELYYSPSPGVMGRYDFDPETGKSALTHLFRLPKWGFPGFEAFPHYTPVMRKGQVYLVSNGRFVLRPDLQSGKLIPVAFATFKPWEGWRPGAIPEVLLKAAELQKLDIHAKDTDAFTWSDRNGNGLIDPEEFLFCDSATASGYAFLDADFNVYFGFASAPNISWTGKRWIGFDFESSCYATLPNEATDGDAPVWDWKHLTRSREKMPDDVLGLLRSLRTDAIRKEADGRIHVYLSASPGGHTDRHPDVWPTAQACGMRVMTVKDGQVAQIFGKHASEGAPRDVQFGFPGNLIGTVDGNLIVCDRMMYTTAWTPDGLCIGTLMDRRVKDRIPDKFYKPMTDDFQSAGSVTDLGGGEGVWFSPGWGDRAVAIRVSGFRDIERQSGVLKVAAKPAFATPDGNGLKAEYFDNADLSGHAVVTSVNSRLWFFAAAWAKGPCAGIEAKKPFSVRWTGSLTTPFSEPFWFRVYNGLPGLNFCPDVQGWSEQRGYARVWLNGQLVLDKWMGSPATNPWQTPALRLVAGETYDLKVEYSFPGGDGAQFSFVWCSSTMEWMRVPKPYLKSSSASARPRITVRAALPDTLEGGVVPGVVRFSVDKVQGKDMTIFYRLGGTASTSDYEPLSGQVVIPAGKESADVSVRALADGMVEADEICVVTLAVGSGYMGDGTDGAATVNIKDADNLLMDASLAVYYTFDNDDVSGGVIRNEIGADFHQKINQWMVPAPKLTEGPGRQFGNALWFPEGREQTESLAAIRLEGDYTVAFWFKTARTDAGICGIGALSLGLARGRLVALNAGWFCVQPEGVNLADDRWHHGVLAWSMAKKLQTVYVDGIRVRVDNAPTAAGGTIGLGRCNGHEWFKGGTFSGALDEFRVYRRQLSDDEVRELFEERTGRLAVPRRCRGGGGDD